MSVWHEVVSCLLLRGLVSQAAVVDGELSVEDLTGDRDTFVGRLAPETAFVVKFGFTRERNAAIVRESDVYAQLAADARVQRFLPRSYGYDSATRALVVEYLPGRRTLLEQRQATGRFSSRSAASVGVALATLHRVEIPLTVGMSVQPVIPWALQLHRPTGVLLRLGSVLNQRWIATMQRFPELGIELDALRAQWAVSALTHHDVKWANIVVTAGRRPDVSIIDWELAQPGDPAWDVGSFFSEYLTCWLRSMPPLDALEQQTSASLATIPLASLQPAMRSFWGAYTRAFGLRGVDADLFLELATRYCAARMLQSGYERLQAEEHASPLDSLLLQVCLNMLRQPRGAMTQLFGIAPPLGVVAPVASASQS